MDRANAIANAAAPYVATFTAAGFAPTFLDGLRALAAQLQDSFGGRTDHLTKRRGSTIGVGTETANGRRALIMLDAVIEQQLPPDAPLLAEWRAVRRIPKKLGPARGASAPASSTSTTAPPAPSTPATQSSTAGGSEHPADASVTSSGSTPAASSPTTSSAATAA